MGRLGACGLSALLFRGPRGPGRDGGGGAPLPAALCPADIRRGAVGLGGGDLQKPTETLTAKREREPYSGRKLHSTVLSKFLRELLSTSFLSQNILTPLHGDPRPITETNKALTHLTRPVRCLQHANL